MATANAVERYLSQTPSPEISVEALGFYATIDAMRAVSPRAADSIVNELADQRSNVKLIASENYCSLATQLAQGTLLTDKYAEGYPGHRFYAGCDNVDAVESEAVELAKGLFGAEHAYVQPHSGADANLVAFLSILATRVEANALERLGQTSVAKLAAAEWAKIRDELHNQRLLGMDYYSGGHLTHGYRLNVSARLFDVHSYSVDRQTKLLDLDALAAQAREVQPLILLAGYSAYPRRINFARMREIADDVGAVFMVDMSHFAGLVAGGVFRGDFDPVAHAHVVTTTTHKTLRGPRGGMVLCTAEFAEAVDKGCPAILGGPLPHVIAAKVLALREASRHEFADYAGKIVSNARALAGELMKRGVPVLTGGTDNHLLLVDVAEGFGLTGRQAESALRASGMTLNRNALPFDSNGPWFTSGLRLGTPAVTTLGMGEEEMAEVADVMHRVLGATRPASASDGTPSRSKHVTDSAVSREAAERIAGLMARYPVYPQIDLDLVR
ncbi:MAG: glycine hydroxymethyltransferase [Micromonosporaceae bacterium]